MGVGINSVATIQEMAGDEREATMQPKRHYPLHSKSIDSDLSFGLASTTILPCTPRCTGI
jgi:hypothetical protein